jgi:hypothetical protein
MFLEADSGTGAAKLSFIMALTNKYDLSNPCVHILNSDTQWLVRFHIIQSVVEENVFCSD